MARVDEVERARVVDDLGRDRVHVAREQGHRLHRVELAQDRRRRARGRRRGRPRARSARAGCGRPRARSSSCSATMSLFSSTAGSGSTNRLAPGARAAVDDARDLAAVLGLQQQHVAVVARGDELVLQQPVGVLAAEEATPSRDVSCDLQAQRGCGAVSASRGEASSATSPDGQDGAADGGGHVARVARPREARLASARRALGARHAPGDLDAALDERGDVEEGARLEVQALDAGGGQGLGEVGQVVVGLAAERREAGPPPRWSGRRASRTAAGIGRAAGGPRRGPVPRPTPPAAGGAPESCRTRVLRKVLAFTRVAWPRARFPHDPRPPLGRFHAQPGLCAQRLGHGGPRP